MNRQTTEDQSTLIRSKLARSVLKLQEQFSVSGKNKDLPTLESLLAEASKIMTDFYKKLPSPIFEAEPVAQDTPPTLEKFNKDFQDIFDDLTVVFDEFENMEGVVLANFNYMASKLNLLNAKLKSVSSKVGDYILFSNLPLKDAFFFSDSFNNLNRVEFNSPLLNKEQCEINQIEGIATLPILRDGQVPIRITQLPIVNSNSNGVSGNNQELGVLPYSDITQILDNNADTWYEYERVVTQDDGVPLILDITLSLGETKVINFIRINPNNFGTRTQIQIETIETSIDGKDFVNVKDDIPIAGFFAEDEDNVFILAPSTSKYAGQGFFTFTPREAKYVHIVLKQTTPYIIKTNQGDKFRYAIGIRDIEVQALPYKEEGELISKEYASSDEIRKVVLLSNQSPDASALSDLVSIDHFISPDNGLTWHQIRPRNSDGLANQVQEIPELINFNSADENAIMTSSAVYGIRYKALMKRNPDAFVDSSAELAQEIENKTELHTVPTTTPFEIQLQQKPIQESIKIIDPQLGSRGREDVKYHIAQGTGNKMKILLPFKPLRRDIQKVQSGSNYFIQDLDPQRIYVDNELWSRSLTASSTSSSKHYSLNFEEGILQFGDGTTGKLVPQGAKISMSLTEEQIFPSRGEDHLALLQYPTSHDKKIVEVSVVYPTKTDSILLKKGVTRHQLKEDITEDTMTFSDGNVFHYPRTFVDGSSEFTGGAGDYSIDYDNGVLYSYSKTSTTVDTTVTYKYTPRTYLSESDWDFADMDSGTSNAISIKNSAFSTFTADPLVVPKSVQYFNLAHLGIVKGTLSFTDSIYESTVASLSKEVEFIDGRTELLGLIKAVQQLASIEDVVSGDIVTIPFTMKITGNGNFGYTFSNTTVFSTETSSMVLLLVASPGTYFVDRTAGTTGRIHVKVSGEVQDPGTVTYYYSNPQVTLDGRYSVNYETGEVFLYTPTHSTRDITARYEYTNYRIKYNIARLISSDDWKYDTNKNKVVLEDREILKNLRTPQTFGEGTVSISKFYQVSYQYIKSVRANISALEPYFSPILKDYSCKVITLGRLV